MTKPDTWMPLFIGDYLADTGHLSTAEHGAYLLLLMSAWTRGGVLPDDDAQLARITRASVREWKTLRASLAPFFHVADGVWRQQRLLMELTAASARSAKAGAKASTAASARWGKGPPDDAPSIATSNAPSIAQALLEQCPPPSPIPKPKTEDQKQKRRAEARLPPDFAVSDRVRDWAVRKGFDNPDAYLEIFVGRHLASGRRYADWDQALMNAIREDWYGLRKPLPLSAKKSKAELYSEICGRSDDRSNTIEGVAERVDSATIHAIPIDLRKPRGDDVGERGQGGSVAGVG